MVRNLKTAVTDTNELWICQIKTDATGRVKSSLRNVTNVRWMLSYRGLLFPSFAVLTGDCNQHVVPTSLHSGFHAFCVSAQIALRHKQTGLTQLPTIEKTTLCDL